MRRPGRHRPGQRPLPDRVHRLGRRAGGHRRAARCSPPTAATAPSRPSRWRRPVADPCRHRHRRGRGPARRGPRAWSAAAGRRVGLEADDVTWAAQRVAGASCSRASVVPTSGVGRGAARGEGRRRARPDGRGGGHRRRRPGRGAPAAGSRRPGGHRGGVRRWPSTRRCAGAEPRTGPSRPSWPPGPNSAKPHHRADRPADRARATRWWSTSARPSRATART